MQKILIVEDELYISDLYKRVFEKEAFEVQVADNGQIALEKLENFKADIILLDVMMPQMNGFETLDHIKSNAQTKDIPVIIISNITDPKEIEFASLKGAAKYIIKSQYLPKQLVQLIKNFMQE